MGNDISSRPTFHSLGTRDSFLLSKTAKAEAFIKGLDAIKAVLDGAHSFPRPCSVPQLIHMIFDDSLRNEQLELIREVIRQNPSFGSRSYDISASGTKLMACLATVMDPNCFDEAGYLRVDFTKSLIRGWFANGDTISLDDSALQNMRIEPTSTEVGFPKIILGKNRLSDVSLLASSEISSKLSSNYKAAQLGKTDIALNLSSIPKKTVTAEFTEATIGDMNGNSLMFLHELVSLGFATIQHGKEWQWEQLAQKIRSNDVSNFKALLSETIEFKSTDKKLVLLGDLLSDRTFNDWFTLNLIDFMHEQGQSFEIIFSNHDAAFVEYFLANKDKPSDSSFFVSGSGFKHAVNPNISLARLNETLNQNPDLRGEFNRLVQTYLSHLNIVGCSKNQQQFYSHGVINQNMVEDMLTLAGIDEPDQANLGIQEKIWTINRYFHEHAFGSAEAFRKFMAMPEDGGNYHDHYTSNPFFFSIWNIGPFSSNRNYGNNPLHRYCNAQLPVGVTQAIHGHTEQMSARMRREQHREIVCRALKIAIDREPEKDLRTWIEQVLPLLIDLESQSARPDLLGRIFVLFLDKINTMASAENKIDLIFAINQFLADCDKFPRSEVAWFEAYDSKEPGDLVMREKQRQIADGRRKPEYIHIPKTDHTYVNIKLVFNQARQVQMTIMTQSLKILFDRLYAATGKPTPDIHDHALENFSEATANNKGVIKEISKRRTDGSNGATESNLHSKVIAEFIDTEIGAMNNAPLRTASLAAMHDIECHLSLDGSFGAMETDVSGEKSVMLN